MNGDTHNFYGVIFGTIALSLISGLNGGSLWFLGIITNILAVMVYGIATLSDNKIKREQKAAKKSGNVEKGQDKSKTHKKEVAAISRAKKFAFVVLYTNLVVVCATAHIVDDQTIGVQIAIAFLGMILVIAGAFFPDLDTLLFGVETHRNPLTHSWVLATFAWTVSMIAIPYDWRVFDLLAGLYCLGYASHLILDTVPSTAGFFEGIKEFFNLKNAPGDLRGVPEKWEHPWLFAAAVWLIVLFVTSVMRFYGLYGFDYSAEGWNDSTILLTALGYGSIGLWVILSIIGRALKSK